MGQGVSIRDRFANVAFFDVTMAAANVEAFASLNTNMGFLGRRDQALAMVIDEVQYMPSQATVNQLDAEGDSINMAITDSDLVTDLTDLSDRRILDAAVLSRIDMGTAGSGQIFDLPLRKQFFPPLITAARTLFLGLDTISLASAGQCRARLLFRVETLTGAELVELSEVFRLTG